MDSHILSQSETQHENKRKKFFVVRKKKTTKSESKTGNGSNSSNSSKKTVVDCHLHTDTNTNKLVKSESEEFLASLTEVQREVMNIANEHLESSFSLPKSNGCVEFYKEKIKNKNKK